MLCLAACNRGNQNKDAIRQGVLDHFGKVGLNVASMTVEITSVQFNGNQADATVSVAPKGSASAQPISMQYHLESKDNRWAVVGRKDAGGSQHGGMTLPQTAPGMTNPHAGGTPEGAAAPGAGGKMPSPESLPPAGQKK
jgi:hypothetical protein